MGGLFLLEKEMDKEKKKIQKKNEKARRGRGRGRGSGDIERQTDIFLLYERERGRESKVSSRRCLY